MTVEDFINKKYQQYNQEIWKFIYFDLKIYL